ncbi:hypothetical protein BAU15_11095 [Enterococcus sp. JM4C]|uniref:hypothetical protein n=1 Tax=Candidatus Enterococcus huntleyi TaxID=1857217 RepID=UPI00137A8CAD|nr:hypothetical protein [Enterococcus sp. JM4C]KAF1298664.1 hypothetical protein BAU15_11095 [Enterococcus sp. JM4C]
MKKIICLLAPLILLSSCSISAPKTTESATRVEARASNKRTKEWKSDTADDSVTSADDSHVKSQEIKISLVHEESTRGNQVAQISNNSSTPYYLDLMETDEEVLTEDGWKAPYELSGELIGRPGISMGIDIPAKSTATVPINLDVLPQEQRTYRFTYYLYSTEEERNNDRKTPLKVSLIVEN